MVPAAGQKPGKNLIDALTKDFGSVDNFVAQFTDAAANHFGSGK